MVKTESFKFILQVDVRYIGDPPRRDDAPPELEQVEKALLEKLRDFEVEDFPADVKLLAKTVVKRGK